MCGIAGTLILSGDDSQRVDEALLTRMRDTMILRGPDGGANWLSEDGRVGLAHRRLSIIDLSTVANQPMANEDGSIHVVFNGEIYNHAAIRAELQQLGGHVWRTDHSDTEVILHAYEQWGIDCLERFRGMFAIALWDGRTGELYLIRDRIGIKPLYYSKLPGRLNFASEIKALLEDPSQKRAVNEQALYHYLSFLTTPAPMTLFEGIHKLPGGTWLRISANGEVREHRYWDVLDHTTSMQGKTDDEIASLVLDELRQAVALRKVSDVPVGVFLSGGIDSSTNAALFSEGESSPVRTFSIGYKGEYQTYTNELHYARKMADQIGAEHHELELTIDDLMSFLPTMVHLQDEPIADPVCVPVYYVSKLARDNGVVVCQVGEGADELFWGYPSWRLALKLQQWDNLPCPRFAKRLLLGALGALGRDETLYYEWLRRGGQGQRIFWGGAEAFTHVQKHRLLSPTMREKFANASSWDVIGPLHRRFLERAKDPSDLNWMTYLDLQLRLPELLLMRVDKMSMGVSLEARVPFLDHKFVELAMSIPQRVKTRGGVLKHILKKAVRGIIPDELIDRKKQGFGVPVHEWFMERLGEEMMREVDAFCRETDYLDPEAVRRLYESGQGTLVWNLFNLALWWKRFIRNA